MSKRNIDPVVDECLRLYESRDSEERDRVTAALWQEFIADGKLSTTDYECAEAIVDVRAWAAETRKDFRTAIGCYDLLFTHPDCGSQDEARLLGRRLSQMRWLLELGEIDLAAEIGKGITASDTCGIWSGLIHAMLLNEAGTRHPDDAPPESLVDLTWDVYFAMRRRKIQPRVAVTTNREWKAFLLSFLGDDVPRNRAMMKQIDQVSQMRRQRLRSPDSAPE